MIAITPLPSISSIGSSSPSSSAFVDANSAASPDNPNSATPSFGDTLKNAFSEVNDLQNKSADMSTAFVTGQTSDIHSVMIAMQKASVALTMTMEIRNKVVEAYQEIMRVGM
jgi:flagellar hook-basal body complex protein FliE